MVVCSPCARDIFKIKRTKCFSHLFQDLLYIMYVCMLVDVVSVVFVQQFQQHAATTKKENPADLAEVRMCSVCNTC